MQNTLKILVADDHYANLLLTQSLLQREGHDVVLARDGKDALRMCSVQPFSLILLDIQMPIMDGPTALRHIRALPNSNAITLIFALTAHSEPSQIQQFLSYGFNAVLQKPFRIAELSQIIQTGIAPTHHTPVLRPPQEDQREVIDFESIPILETTTINILLEAIGPTRMEKVLTAYWQDADKMNMSLQSTRLSQPDNIEPDLVKLRKTAHGLKGASANIGLLRASRIAAKLQNAPIEMVPYLIEKLDSALHESRPAIYRHCGLTPHIAQMPLQYQARSTG